MITTKKLLGAAALGLATLVGSTAAIAQVDAENYTSGLLGKRYAGADFLFNDYRDLSDNGYGGVLLANNPISEVIDLTGSYTYNQVNSQTTDLTQSLVAIGGKFYRDMGYYKPFFSGGLGYEWTKWEFPAPAQADNDEGVYYSIGAGVEVSLAEKTSAVGEFTYRDGVDSDIEDAWGLELGVTHWFTPKVAFKASVYIVEDDSVSFRLGGRFAF